MKRMRRITFLITVALLCAVTVSQAQKKKEVRKMEYNSAYNFEVATVAVGVDGTKLIKVSSYGKKDEDAQRKAKADAIACALFKGFPAGGGGRAAKTPAIITDSQAATKHAEFFEKFFAPGGEYLNFVNMSSDVVPERIKVSKKMIKVTLTVSVAFDALRKRMEEEGIARSLDAGF